MAVDLGNAGVVEVLFVDFWDHIVEVALADLPPLSLGSLAKKGGDCDGNTKLCSGKNWSNVHWNFSFA